MSEYTPTTESVREAYVRAMRNAFVASAGEHRAEFDRWLAEHDSKVLEAFAEEVCDRNARLGLTESARHFGRTYGRLARDRAAEIWEGK